MTDTSRINMTELKAGYILTHRGGFKSKIKEVKYVCGVVTYTPDGASNLFGEDETDIVEIIKKVPYPLMQSESFGEF